MWGAIKKALNSTLGTKRFKPLDVQAVNDGYSFFYNALEFLKADANVSHVHEETGIRSVNARQYQYAEYRYVVLPPTTAYIGQEAFISSALEKITIPTSVYDIDDGAFSYTPLRTVKFLAGSKLKKIGARAFGSCNQLVNITIPEGVTEIAPDAFVDCSRLMNIYVPWKEGEVEGAPWGAPNPDVAVIYEWSGD